MSLPPLATVAALEVRLGVPIGSLADLDLARAQAALDDASELVRIESGIAWVDEVTGEPAAPPSVVVVVLQVAKRVFINPDGLTSESVEGYSWQTDQQSMGIYLSEDELRTVRNATKEWYESQGGSGRWPGMGSITMRPAWRPRRERREWYQ